MFECHLFHGETQMDVVTDLQAKNTKAAVEKLELTSEIIKCQLSISLCLFTSTLSLNYLFGFWRKYII